MDNNKTNKIVIASDVLIKYPTCLYAFPDCEIIISDRVIGTIENIACNPKNDHYKSAKAALDEISYCVASHPGGGMKNIELINGGIMSIAADVPGENEIQSLILLCKTTGAVLLTNKLSIAAFAAKNEIKSISYTGNLGVSERESYSGRAEFFVDEETFSEFYRQNECDIPDEMWLEENQFVLMKNEMNPDKTAVGYHKDGKIFKLKYNNLKPYGVSPRNLGQQFAIEALLRPVTEAPLVVLKGAAGTAKTYLALAAGLQKVVNDNEYNKILVTRPNIKFDADIGYLKGGEVEKIAPLIRPIMDNLEQLTRTKQSGTKDGYPMPDNYADELFSRGIIKAEAMAYMRGRSIANNWLIVDEAQNMTPAQAYGIVTRVGVGTKVVLCGDPEQVDISTMNAQTNGLTYLSEKMRGSPLCWQMEFSKNECERSDLAKETLLRLKPDKNNRFVLESE